MGIGIGAAKIPDRHQQVQEIQVDIKEVDNTAGLSAGKEYSLLLTGNTY